MTLQMESEADAPEAAIWEWLLQVIQKLGVDGMSSEDTDNSNGIETIYRVRILPWRRRIDRELAIIDGKRLHAGDIYHEQGAKPSKHLRSLSAPHSRQKPVCKLPRVLYDNDWYEGLTDPMKERTICVSKEQFRWLEIIMQ